MIDHRFGKLLDELHAQDRWDTTAVIVCTHHGHDLGDVRSTGAPGETTLPTSGARAWFASGSDAYRAFVVFGRLSGFVVWERPDWGDHLVVGNWTSPASIDAY